jgi:hypothetical protein
LDSARFDDVSACLATPPYKGISNYQSTRKQWLIMLGQPAQSIENKLFILNETELAEKNEATPFEMDQSAKNYKVGFLLDDGTTANRGNLPLQLSEVRINAEGIEMAGAPQYLPLSGWLQNILAPVESANIYSDIESFFVDSYNATDRNDLLFAHTCYLAHSITRWDEFHDMEGLNWLWRHPIYYQLHDFKSANHPGVADRDISRFKLSYLLKRSSQFTIQLASKYQNIYGLITSDHGQDFEGVSKEIGLSVHGFSASPGTVWIPMIPFGGTRINSSEANSCLTWENISLALLASLRQNSPLTISTTSGMVFTAFPYILPPLSNRNTNNQDILDMNELSANTIFRFRVGAYFLPSRPITSYRKCFTIYTSDHGLFTINPLNDHVYELRHWDSYRLLSKSTFPILNLQAVLENRNLYPSNRLYADSP